MKNIRGFTLVELIIVVTILSILAIIGFMSYQSYTSDARDASRITSFGEIGKGMELFRMKNSSYPTPDNPVTLSGGNTIIVQGVLGINSSQLIRLTNEVKDPKTNGYYLYSISGDGQYYQLATDLEKTVSYNNLANTTYADATKALVKGNYKFDPSLPSLITVSGSVNSASGIFDPNVCFVIDGGTNLTTSNSGTCLAKKNMNLKDFDDGLVGYWDMETLSGTMLKDLSGNGNEASCFDRNGATVTNVNCSTKISSTGSFSKSMQFDFDGSNIANFVKTNYNLFKDGTGVINYSDGYSISYLMKEKSNIYTQTPFTHNNLWIHNTSNLLMHIRSRNFSSTVLSNAEIIGCVTQPLCINNINFLQNNYNSIITNIHTIVMNDSFSYYINGIKVYEKPIQKTPSLYNVSSLLYLSHPSIGFGLNGYMDDVKIYNRALSDSEIAQQARITGFN